MKLDRVELYELNVKLRFRFETSFGVEQELRKVLLVLHSDGLTGYGEGTANNTPGYSYETVDTVWTALSRYILPQVVDKEYATPAALLHDLRFVRGHNMAVGALETALWDMSRQKLPDYRCGNCSAVYAPRTRWARPWGFRKVLKRL